MQEEVIILLKKMHKKLCLLSFIMFMLANTGYLHAEDSLTEKETKAYATVAGIALACKAKKLPEYEFIVNTIIKAKVKTDDEASKAIYDYAFAKAYAFKKQKTKPASDCRNSVARFNSQKIFSSVILKDGRIKTPDGVWHRPTKPYDVRTNKVTPKK